MPVEMSRLSLEYVWWPLEANVPIEGTTIEVAILPLEQIPTPTDWEIGDIVEVDVMGTPTAFVRVLVGPGGLIAPPPGENQTWVAVQALGSPERPVRRPGSVVVE